MTDLRTRIAHLLAEQHGSCLPSHWRTADRVLAEVEAERIRAELQASTRFDPVAAMDAIARARALLDAPQTPSTPAPVAAPPEPASGPHAGAQAAAMERHGVWLDDPPRIVLADGYLDRLRGAGIDEIAVMIDGSDPGWDPRWSPHELEALSRAAGDLHRVATIWLPARRQHVEAALARVEGVLRALDSDELDLDVEPAGGWREAHAAGWADEDGDGSRLGEVAGHVADYLAALPPGVLAAVDVDTFPGALRHVRVLVERLARRLPEHVALRYYGQHYAVRHRGDDDVDYSGPLGPERLPREAHEAAVRTLPARAEVYAGLAAYDTSWPGRGSTMATAYQAARSAGARRVRWWSGKWLARMAGHEARAAELRAAILAA